MIRAATKNDIPSIRAICKHSFDTDDRYLDFFFTHCTSKLSFVYEKDGEIVSALHTIGLSYVSAKRIGSYRTFYPGLYIYGVSTAENYRNRGYASALLTYIKNNTLRLGWNFLLLRPSETSLIDFYNRNGFTTPIYRNKFLPLTENRANIIGLSPADLFIMRDHKLLSNYFQWSHIMLDYIIKEAVINPPDPIPETYGNDPYALLCPLSKDFRLDSNSAIFSFPLE